MGPQPRRRLDGPKERQGEPRPDAPDAGGGSSPRPWVRPEARRAEARTTWSPRMWRTTIQAPYARDATKVVVEVA